ncbi:rhodanese-like domain-containing protein [Aquincola sp. MAHUQ-54]|uniref:Rhodanese-like domain-containing protein n=1 Tax=Aquincola agrisoli TaxID=3119538 RepID=A0AAW9QBS0_9BURK
MPDTAPAALLHSAFYRFTPLADPAAAAAAVRRLAAGLQGSITLAAEGLSGAVSGTAAAVHAFEAALQQPGTLGGVLRGMAFKHSACTTAPFGRLKVVVKPEIVALGLPGGDALPPPDERDASHLPPAAWRALLARDDVVLLDNRNHFEFRLGHFRGAADPQVRNFRDFVAYVQAHAPAWRAAGTPVAMYCTGGVRCDKTAPWLRSLGLDVFQLEGGILNYFQQLPDADRDWQGECFVFDNRLALDSRLRETATTADQVFDATDAGEAWRLARARRLDAS